MDWKEIREEALDGLDLSLVPPKVKLPALPYAVTLFVQRSRDESVPLAELAKILETDAGLTIQLLKHVNSTFFAVRNKVVSRFPRVNFKQEIAEAFFQGFEHKPETTVYTCNEDICSHFIQNYRHSNFYDQVQNSPFQNS